MLLFVSVRGRLSASGKGPLREAPLYTGALVPFPASILTPFYTGALVPFYASTLTPFYTGALVPFHASILTPFYTGVLVTFYASGTLLIPFHTSTLYAGSILVQHGLGMRLILILVFPQASRATDGDEKVSLHQ